jgi:hypothetical protein
MDGIGRLHGHWMTGGLVYEICKVVRLKSIVSKELSPICLLKVILV